MSAVSEEEPTEETPAAVINAADRQFGRYQLCYEIASGGMATLYLARAKGPGGYEKLVALKRIHPHLAKKKAFVEMFLDEARIASRLSHPNVCGVIDFGQQDGVYYLAMDYLVGETLSRVLRKMGDPGQWVSRNDYPALPARIVADACEGLHSAHELRDASGNLLHVVHRDVSPQNLFITYDGTTRIVDFGIASAADRVHQTTTGTVKGKYGYMAPEQVRGGRVDRRADVWSLGVVLWELLTLNRLFRRGTDAETIFSLASSPIVPPSQIRPGIPPELDAIVMKALSRDPADRFATAREMGRALTRVAVATGQPVGPAEVSDLMSELFPDGREKKTQLLEHARTAEVALPPEPSSMESHASGASVSRMRSVPQSSRRLWWIVAAVLGCFAAGSVTMVVLVGMLRSGEPTAETLAAPTVGTETPAGAETATDTEETAAATETDTATDTDTDMDTDTDTATDTEPETEPGTETPTDPGDGARAADRRDRRADEDDGAARDERGGSDPARTPRATGVLNLSTPGGWAIVLHNGRRIGQTPGRFTLPAGDQVITLLPFGEPPARRITVEVPRGGTERQSVPLE